MTIRDVINKFETTPFLFVGSGLTRRYLGLPSWNGLLDHFAREIKNDDFTLAEYKFKTGESNDSKSLLPKAAELIEHDYNAKWFNDPGIRHTDDASNEKIIAGASPFKMELALYLKSISKENEAYHEEIQQLKALSEKSISGYITTNYDTFLEDLLPDYKCYIGQSDIIFEPVQSIAEIYKIHGSVERPESIVITESDYREFEKRQSCLSAKLMTIFVEYPIIFIGYSLSDNNIDNIIKWIADSLDSNQLQIFRDRFVVVNYDEAVSEPRIEIMKHPLRDNSEYVQITTITLSDFSLLYNELRNNVRKLPVRLLRRFKDELYDFVIDRNPTDRMKVALLEDKRVADDELVLAIGKAEKIGLYGLAGITGNDWYRNVVMDDIPFSNEDMLTYGLPNVMSHFGKKIPIHKYLVGVNEPSELAKDIANNMVFTNIVGKTYRKHHEYIRNYSSMMDILEKNSDDLHKSLRLMAFLKEDEYDCDKLEEFLKNIFIENYSILNNSKPEVASSLRLMIKIYDYLKWGKNKQ